MKENFSENPLTGEESVLGEPLENLIRYRAFCELTGSDGEISDLFEDEDDYPDDEY